MTSPDLACAQLCADSYSDHSQFDYIHEAPAVWMGVRHDDDVTTIACRGSYDIPDWVANVQFRMVMDPDLGGVEEGFITGIRDAFDNVARRIGINPVRITGHSRGAAHGAVLSAIMLKAGAPPRLVILFGCPRPGAEKLKYLLSGTTIRSYRNRTDPVCDLPEPLLDLLPYVHVRDFTPVDVAPADPLDILGDHHILNYVTAMEKI
jgi:hypothetical protein